MASATSLLATLAEKLTFLMLLISKKKGISGNNYLDKEFNILLIGINTLIYLLVSKNWKIIE